MAFPTQSPYVIIGAGIHGLSTAYHLALELKARGKGSGKDIIILDKSGIAAGATGIACGVIRNNYFQPSMRELMAHSVNVWESDPAAYSYHPVGYMQISCERMHADVASIYEQQKAIGYSSHFIEGEKDTIEITIKIREISGIWDRNQEGFQQADMNLGQILLKNLEGSGRMTIQQLILGSALTEDTNERWQQKYHGNLENFSMNDGDTHFNVDKIGVAAEINGTDLKTYQDIRKQYFYLADNIDNMQLTDMKNLFNGLDNYLQLLSSSESRVTVEGIRMNVDGTMQLEELELSGDMEKDPKTGRFDLKNQ